MAPWFRRKGATSAEGGKIRWKVNQWKINVMQLIDDRITAQKRLSENSSRNDLFFKNHHIKHSLTNLLPHLQIRLMAMLHSFIDGIEGAIKGNW